MNKNTYQHHPHTCHDHDRCCHGQDSITASKAGDRIFSEPVNENYKTYIMEGLDCANCAAKMEMRIQAMPEVKQASIIFATKQLRIYADDPDALLPEIESECRSIENGVTLLPYHSAAPEKSSFFRENFTDIISITAGLLIFIAGIICRSMISGPAIILIFAAAYLILGWKVLFTAVRNIAGGQVFDENFLMSTATIAAFCIGEFAEGAGVMLFYRIGELFEHIAVEKSRSQIMEAVDMRPENVILKYGDTEKIVPAEDAHTGDTIIIRPGDRIPLDSVVIAGESRIDTSPITGEPVPVRVTPGSEITSGCINQQGLLTAKVLKPLKESMVTKILSSVENAAAGKPKIDRFITRFARIYTPIVVILALLTAIVPSFITGNWQFWITTAITFLVISCPCALVISVPLAFFSGIGAASRVGILFKGGISIEALRNVKAVTMDKTGTLTKGDFSVSGVAAEESFTEEQILSVAASCEMNSTHPIALSITQEAAKRGIIPEKAVSAEEISGMGIKAALPSGEVICGSRSLLLSLGITVPDHSTTHDTEVYIAVRGKFAGSISISDTLKPDARSAVSKLISMNLVPVMLTGDKADTAEKIASESGIDRFRAQLLPDDKLSALKDIRSELGPVMFVGDGINDAPVLAGADVGAAMGSGADAAIEAADVVFMKSSAESIPQSISIANSTGRIANQNVVIALSVKLIVLLLGFAGFANIWAAVFADTGVAMICILNSLRILWKKF